MLFGNLDTKILKKNTFVTLEECFRRITLTYIH